MQESEKITAQLERKLKRTDPCELTLFLQENANAMVNLERPFSSFMHNELRRRHRSLQRCFLDAGIPERYGYKLLSEEKHSRKRDTILRLCLGGHFDLNAVNTALKLNGMSPLYARFPRDSAFIIAFNTDMWDPNDVDMLLRKNNLEPLQPVGEQE